MKINQNKKLIALEGHSFSGKTTLINDIAVGNYDGVAIIQEYDLYAGGAENFPPVPSQSTKDARDNVDYFLELEVKRSQDALKALRAGQSTIIFDRSFYSVLLFQYYLKENKKDWPHAFEYAQSKFIKGVNSSRIFAPTNLILMDTLDSQTFISRTKRKISLSFYTEQSTQKFMNDKYDSIREKLYDNNSAMKLKSSNGIESRKLLVKKVLGFIETSIPSEKIFNIDSQFII